MSMVKMFVVTGAISGGMSVALGAFGAHGLRGKVSAGELPERMLEVWATAAQYQMTHALALFGAAWVLSQTQAQSALVGGWAFLIGTLLFSGSLYAMVLTQVKVLGAITPVGGVAFLVGWIGLAMAGMSKL